jgi:hypothetical protein
MPVLWANECQLLRRRTDFDNTKVTPGADRPQSNVFLYRIAEYSFGLIFGHKLAHFILKSTKRRTSILFARKNHIIE